MENKNTCAVSVDSRSAMQDSLDFCQCAPSKKESMKQLKAELSAKTVALADAHSQIAHILREHQQISPHVGIEPNQESKTLLGISREDERTAVNKVTQNQEKLLASLMKEQRRANEDQQAKKAQESEAKCTKCRELVYEVVQLKKECDKLQNQFHASQKTVLLLENALEQGEIMHSKVQSDLENKLKGSEENAHQQQTEMLTKINDLKEANEHMQNETNLQITNIKDQSKDLEVNLLRERQEEKAAILKKVRDFEEEKGTQTQKIDELEQKSKNMEENFLRESRELLKKIGDFEEESRTQTQKIDELQLKVGQLKNALESSKRRTTNQRTIHDGMVDQMNELEHQNQQLKTVVDAANAQLVAVTAERDEARTERNNMQTHNTALDAANAQLVAVTAERDEARTERNNMQTHNAALHDLIAQFRQQLQYFEHQQPQITDDLRFYQQPQGANNILRSQGADDS